MQNNLVVFLTEQIHLQRLRGEFTQALGNDKDVDNLLPNDWHNHGKRHQLEK